MKEEIRELIESGGSLPEEPHRAKKRKRQYPRRAALKLTELRTKQDARYQEWLALPDPKDDYFDWFYRHPETVREITHSLHETIVSTRRDNDKLKAADLALRYQKSLPKQTHSIEVEEVQPQDPALLLEAILELNGYSVEKFKQFADNNPPTTQ